MEDEDKDPAESLYSGDVMVAGMILKCLRSKIFWGAVVLVLLVFSLLLSVQAGPYIEAGMGKHGLRHNNYWDGDEFWGARAGFGYIWHDVYFKGLDFDLGYTHDSQPFYWGDDESSNDSVIGTLRYEWR